MAVRRDGHRGGIAWLVALLEEYGEPIEFDMWPMGLRPEHIGSRRFDWRDFRIFTQWLPESSAFARARLGEHAGWGYGEWLLASISDAAWAQVWQNGDGKSPRPEPAWRPGQTQEKPRHGMSVEKFEKWRASREARIAERRREPS